MLEAKWGAGTAGGCLSQVAEGELHEPRVMTLTEISPKRMRLFWVPKVSHREDNSCHTRPEESPRLAGPLPPVTCETRQVLNT